QLVIQNIMNELTTGKSPSKPKEIKAIREAVGKGNTNTLKTVKVDLYVENAEGQIYLFDLKTAKPNISNFKDFKRTLLEWAGIVLTQNPKIKVETLVAIPYN